MNNQIIERIRQAIQTGPISTEKKPPPQLNEARLFDATLDEDQRIKLFTERAETSDAHVHVINGANSLPTVITEIIPPDSRIVVGGMDKINRTFSCNLPTLLGAYENVKRSDQLSTDQLFETDAGITPVDFAIAETGSVVVSSGTDLIRAPSLLPSIHVALIHPDQIASDLIDLKDQLASVYSETLPGALTLISGPSKTADIEMNLVVGVHGPGQLHLVIIR